MRLGRRKTAVAAAISLFIAAEIALGILLQTIPNETYIYYAFASVVLACLFCALFAERSVAYLCTQLALVCTVCADRFLVLERPPIQRPALIFFSMAQLLYFARLYDADGSPRRRRVHLVLRAVLSVIAFAATCLVLRESADAVALISVFYYAQLALNVVFAFLLGRGHRLMAISLLLFIGCDTLIGLAFLGSYVTISPDSPIYALIHPGFDLAWALYVPSQTLMAVSLLPHRWRRL